MIVWRNRLTWVAGLGLASCCLIVYIVIVPVGAIGFSHVLRAILLRPAEGIRALWSLLLFNTLLTVAGLSGVTGVILLFLSKFQKSRIFFVCSAIFLAFPVVLSSKAADTKEQYFVGVGAACLWVATLLVTLMVSKLRRVREKL